LNHCLDLLINQNRIALARHQTMRASIDWSWGLLTESEQMFMQQLSVFAGGWTLEASQVICDGDVLNLTSALIKKSLIVANQETRHETRYRLHEMVRQYARERLVEAGQAESVRTRHLKYFRQFCQQTASALKGPTQMEWQARLQMERDNIRAALEHAAQTDTESGLYI
jgi:predicted ATPase